MRVGLPQMLYVVVQCTPLLTYLSMFAEILTGVKARMELPIGAQRSSRDAAACKLCEAHMIKQFCDWLANTWLSQQLSGMDWFVPTIQTIHILVVSAAIVMFAMLNFRLLGLTRSGPPLPELAGAFIPWIWRSLLVLLATGILLTITEPARELLNNVFRLKMLLVIVLAILTAVLRSTLSRDPEYWAVSIRRRHLGQSVAILSLILCVGIVSCGRFIAYV
jgi:hypothetical protein